MVNKQFGLKNNNNFFFWLLVGDLANSLDSTDVSITPVLLETGEILRSLWKCYKLKLESYLHFQMICLLS